MSVQLHEHKWQFNNGNPVCRTCRAYLYAQTDDGQLVLSAQAVGFEKVKVGDTVVRMLGTAVEMRLRVTAVDADYIYTAGPNGWKFRRDNGNEVDEDLGWDGLTKTGSYLVTYIPASEAD